MLRVHVPGVVRILIASVAAVLLLAAPARADLITIHFAGNVDLSANGGAASNPYSGFFTWNTSSLPFDSDPPNEADYDVVAYQMIFNGVDETLPIIGDGTGNGMAVLNDIDAVQAGVFVDGLVFFAAIPGGAPSGNDLIFAGLMLGPTSTWGSTALPANVSVLSQLQDRFSFSLDEVPGGGDDNDVPLGRGTFVLTAVEQTPVPEPASVVLTAFGLASALAHRRRTRR